MAVAGLIAASAGSMTVVAAPAAAAAAAAAQLAVASAWAASAGGPSVRCFFTHAALSFVLGENCPRHRVSSLSAATCFLLVLYFDQKARSLSVLRLLQLALALVLGSDLSRLLRLSRLSGLLRVRRSGP